MEEELRLGFLDEAKLSSSQRSDFGLPSQKKYPMPDRAHVMAAIRMFNHVEPKYERELAANIKAKMKQYGISNDQVGEKNRLKRHLQEATDLITFSNLDWDNASSSKLRNIHEGLRLRRRYKRLRY